MTTNANQIQLSGEFTYDEKVAVGAITPGHLIEEDSAGEVQVHSSEGGFSERSFAVEDALQGVNIDTAYAADALGPHHRQNVGARVQAWLKPSTTATVIGAELVSAGDGTLINVADVASGTTVEQVVGIADEALDLSATGAVATRIDIRML